MAECSVARNRLTGRSAPLSSSWEHFSFGGESRGGTNWPSRGLKTHSHNGRWSYLALASGKGARSWVVWKFGLKSGFASLSEGRASCWRPTGVEIDFLSVSENREAEREPWSPVTEFRRWLNRLQQTLTIKPWIEPQPTPTHTPSPAPGGLVNITACSCSAGDSPRMYESSLTREYYSYSALCDADFMSPPIMLYCASLKH